MKAFNTSKKGYVCNFSSIGVLLLSELFKIGATQDIEITQGDTDVDPYAEGTDTNGDRFLVVYSATLNQINVSKL